MQADSAAARVAYGYIAAWVPITVSQFTRGKIASITGADGGVDGGVGGEAPQIVNPERVTDPSVRHDIVCPALMLTPLGPLVPEYLVAPMVMRSKLLSVLKVITVSVIAVSAVIVQRSLLP